MEGNQTSPKAVLITGASTGIGEATALHLLKQGYTVFAGVRRDTDAEHLLEQSGSRIKPIMLDVTSSTSIKDACKIVSQVVGEKGLYGLVNNAGIVVAGPLELVPEHDFRQQFDVNVFGLVEMSQVFLPLLRKAKGRIINMSSIAGMVTYPLLSAYCASKYAVEAISDGLRMELLEWEIAVISIQPGSIKTPIWDKSSEAATERFAHISDEFVSLYSIPLSKLEKSAKESRDRGISPYYVAKTVAKSLSAKRPNARYIVGRDARVQLWLKRLLPPFILDRLVWKSFG